MTRKLSPPQLVPVLAVAVFFVLPSSALADLAGPPSEEQGVQPVLVPGNPKCADYGLAGGTENPIDGYVNKAPNGNVPIGNAIGVNGAVTISNSDGFRFDWDSTIGLEMVIVKAGDNAANYVYDLPGPASSDTRLHGPVKDDSAFRDISHVSFCYDTDGTVIIEKQNVGGPISDAFGFNPSADLDSGSDFTLTDNQTKTYNDVAPNNQSSSVYQVVEKSGLGEPQGYTLTDITCRSGTASDAPVDSDSTVDVFTRTATIKVSPAEIVKCVFTNTRDPQIDDPEIKVVKDVVPDSDSGRFDLKIDSTTFDNGGAGFGDGDTGFQPVSVGQHTVSEVAHSGTNLSDYTSKVVCDSSKGSTDPGTSHTFTVAPGDQVTCTITNTRKVETPPVTPQTPPPTPQTQPPPDTIEVLGVQERKRDTRRPNLVVAGIGDGCKTRDFAARIRVSDASRVRAVTVKLDGRVIKRARGKRVTVLIAANRLKQGRHRLTVTARDAAGNRRTVSRRFTRCAPPVVPNFTG